MEKVAAACCGCDPGFVALRADLHYQYPELTPEYLEGQQGGLHAPLQDAVLHAAQPLPRGVLLRCAVTSLCCDVSVRSPSHTPPGVNLIFALACGLEDSGCL